MTVVRMPPRGHYLAWEVGQLAGVSGQRIGQWARNGYIDSSQSEGPPRVYSYQDVAEAMVVHELRERGVGYRRIRPVIEALRDDLGPWPLTQAKLDLVTTAAEPGRPAAVLVRRRGQHCDLTGGEWQSVIDEAGVVRIVEDLRRGGWAARVLQDLEHIEVDPDRLSGQPTIRGRRVAAQDVAELAETPGGTETLIDGYDLSEAQITDARRWWQATREFEAAA